MIDNNFKDFKNIYKDIHLSEYHIEKKWNDVQLFLPEQNNMTSKYSFRGYGFALLSILILFLVTVGLISASKNGRILTPLNKLTEQLSKNITNQVHLKQSGVTPIIHSFTSLKHLPIPTPTLLPTSDPSKRTQEFNEKEKNFSTPTNTILGIQAENKKINTPTTHVYFNQNNYSAKGKDSENLDEEKSGDKENSKSSYNNSENQQKNNK